MAAELRKDRTLSPTPNGNEKMVTELQVNKCARLQQPKLWQRSLNGWQLNYTKRPAKPSVNWNDRRIGGEECSAELAPNYSRTTTELAKLIWLPPHLMWSCWNGIVRPSAPYKRIPELRSILIRTGQPSNTCRTYETEYGWISDVEQSNRTPYSMPPNPDVARVQVNCAERSEMETWLR